MVAFDKIVAMARIVLALLAGKDGEGLIADVRDAQAMDPEPLFRKVVVAAVLVLLALGFAGTATDHAPLTASLHESGTRTDL